ncbi:MAG TPA: GatB/YqeY domain-containing protein [Candidatus Paceibacterota bacterium]|nr:GatB/YqeY domain-containing protein [Candidatus Paceibacterota bacterium]
MPLHQDIKDGIKPAMIAKDAVKLGVLRGLIADFINELVTKKRRPDELLSDEEAMAVIKRAAKRRMDSIEQFKGGGRNDLAESEEKELTVLKTFIPAGMSREEIEKIALTKKEELQISEPAKAGLLMSHMMKELKGKADGNDVKFVVDKILNK